MTDTAQLPGAAETEVVSKEDALAQGADAFKVALGQIEQPERARNERGEFVGADGTNRRDNPAEEIEAEAEDEPEGEAEEAAESQDDEQANAEAPGEGQPEANALPESWPADKAEMWNELGPTAQAFIRQRDAEQKAATNAKFMEAANVLKANEAIVTEAQSNRQRYAEAVDQVLSLVVPQMPPRSMLDYNSADYDPDQYHYRKAQYEETTAFLEQHKAQLANVRAQEQLGQFHAINNATRDAFISLVPDVADQAKAPAIFQGLMDYAVKQGAPADLFATPTTALEWTLLEKARRWDELQTAKARVDKDPKPEPKKAAPAVKPGVATSRSAIENQRTTKAMDRLRRTGSVEDGAAALKQLLKG